AGAAPSGKNIQNWHFVVIKRRDLMEKIADVITKKQQEILVEMDKVSVDKANRFRKFVKNFTLFYLKAPVLVLVFTKVYNPSGYYELELIDAPKETIDKLFIRNPGMQSLGAAIENFTLSAIELGYGSCWLTSQNYAADEIEAVLEAETGFEKGEYFLGAMLALGVPEDNLKSPSKKPVEEICTFIK
ncbi:TPA: nitroreductase family protein, partial [Clostridioides difficile]|nr:nitroreductase family protein [Clostridioides difficile]